ncbi:MAG: hypothetical protein LUH11_03790 [Candidatus Gastranaerophilales bacterium]|nr:hypothetical protein [Candidatus Gastranaerophilales bacterium]
MADKNNKKTPYQELLNEGNELYANNQIIEAIKVYKTALIMSKKTMDKGTLASMYIKLANAYYKLDNRDKYTYYYEEYLKEYPNGQASVFSRLAHAYYYIDCDKSIDYHNKALNIEVNKYDTACKLFSMTKSSFYDQLDIKEQSEYEIEQIKNTLFKNIKKYTHNNKKKDKNRKINIGYFSSDCHSHTMMNYILPIWENHDKEKYNFYIFNGSEKRDTVTEKIEKTGIEVINCSKMNDAVIAETIYNKNIDILVDLGGYTHLKIFSLLYKPAPVIILYLGYLNTLGMKEVDYILTDRYTIPEDKAYLYTEKPLYLDKGYQIFIEKKVPDISKNPFKTNNYITFGSFNCTSKFNDTTFYMWAKILEEVPNSKLLIYRTQLTKSIIKYIKSRFEKRGISLERIIFSSKKYNTHYEAYSLADISLDPYPFSGMSIAIETALMGVATVTLSGEGMQSRGAARINHIIGLDDLIADCGEDYIKIAANLAFDKQKLEDLRKNLRGKINNSDLKQNAADFTRDLEDKYQKVFNDFVNSP